MRLLIYLAVWKRPEITEICFMGINRLQKSGLFPIEAFAVISEESMKPLCKKYGVSYVTHKNEPLGEKKNYGVRQALLRKDFDYMIEIGSDDILKTEVLELYTWDKPVLSLNDAIMLNSETGSCRKISGARFGVGRAISREALESGNVWDNNSNRSLDNTSTFNLARGGFMERRLKSDEPLAIDIKSEVNIWKYDPRMGEKYPFEKALSGLSEDEVTAIKSLIHVAV